MPSTVQVLANRENAKHSTGPKTAAGKQNSSKNAITHGFYSKAFIVRDEEKADFELMRDERHAEYNPVDTTAVFNLSTIPPDIRHHFNPSADVAAYNRAHHAKWKVYTPEDYVSKETLEAARADHRERSAYVQDFRQQYAKREHVRF